jgi:hypothetical protein
MLEGFHLLGQGISAIFLIHTRHLVAYVARHTDDMDRCVEMMGHQRLRERRATRRGTPTDRHLMGDRVVAGPVSWPPPCTRAAVTLRDVSIQASADRAQALQAVPG